MTNINRRRFPILLASALALLAILGALFLPDRAQAQSTTEIWSATLSPEDAGVSSGYFDFGGGFIDGELTDDDFTFAGTEYTIKETYTGTFGGTTFLYLKTNPRMTSTSAARQDLVFIVDGTRFALSDASDPGNIGNWRWQNPGVTFTEGTDVDLSLEGIVRPRLTDAEVPSNGRSIELEFSEDLDLPSTIPSGLEDAFSVTADGHAMEISSIAKDGSDGLKLNLSASILEDQDVVVSYDRSDAGSNALDDDDGNEVRDFTTGEGDVPAVDNGSTISRPELDSSGVGFDGNLIFLIFDKDLGSPSPPKSAFSITADGSPISIGNITRGDAGLLNLLSLSPVIGKGQTVKLKYTDPTTGDDSNAIQDTDGVDASSFTVTVGNDSTVTLPALTAAAVPADGGTVALTFSRNLDFSGTFTARIRDAFSVTVDGTANAVTGFSGSGDTATLTMADTIAGGQRVVVGYDRSDAGGEALGTSSTKLVADFTTGENSVPAVTNNSTAGLARLASAAVDAAGTRLTLTFNKSLNAVTSARAWFTVTADGADVPIDAFQGLSAAGDSFAILFSSGSPIYKDEAVVVVYEKPADSDGFTDEANDVPVASFTTGEDGVPAVTNDATPVAPPEPDTAASASKVGTGGSGLTLAFDGPLATDNAPPASAFSITAGGVDIGIGAVLLSSTMTAGAVSLAGFTPKVRQGETVALTYTDPTSADDTNALQGTTGTDVHSFTVTVTNASTVTTGPPRPPTGLAATALGATIVDLAWTAPADDGDSAITGYKVEVSNTGSSNWTDLEDNTGDANAWYRHSGLSNGDTRYYRVSAINANGTSPASGSANATTMIGAHHAAPDPIYGTPLWSAKMTVGGSSGTIGYSPNGTPPLGDLSPVMFEHEGTPFTVRAFIGLPSFSTVNIILSAALGAGKYNLHVGPDTGKFDGLATASSESSNLPNVNWQHGDTVDVRLVEATAPAKPTGLTATAAGNAQIDLAWTAPADDGGRAVSGYKIEVSDDGSTGSWTNLVADTGSTDTAYSHTGLSAGDTRHYRVSAINAVGTSDASNSDEATTQRTAPEPPAGVAAIADGTSKIVVSWSAPANDGGSAITGYRIEVSTNGTTWPAKPHVANTGSTDTSYTHTGLGAGNTRHYRVSAINTIGTSQPSAVVSDTTQPGAASCTEGPNDLWCGVVTVGAHTIEGTHYANGYADASTTTNTSDTGALSDKTFSLMFEAGTTNNYTIDSVTVGRDSSAGVLNFSLTSALTAADKEKLVLHVGSRPFAFGDLGTPSTVFSYLWSGSGLDWSSSTSITLRLRRVPAAPGAPTNLMAEADGGTRIELSWTAPVDNGGSAITGYRIEVSVDGSTDWTDLKADTGNDDTSYSHTGLSPGDTRHYRVSAINANGTSEASDSDDATTADPPTLSSAEVRAALGGTDVRLDFSENLHGLPTSVPDSIEAAFTVTADGVELGFRMRSSSETLQFLLSSGTVIYQGQTVVVSYDKLVAGSDAIADSAGDEVASFTTGEDGVPAVVNNSTVVALVSTPTPANFAAAPGNARVVLSWDPPAPDSGVTRHEYRFKEGTGSYPPNWTAIPDSGVGGANQAGFAVTAGLTNETAYTFALRAVSADGESLAAEAGPVTPTPGICGRTPQVRDDILDALSGVDDCAAVTVADLATVTELYIVRQNVTALKSGDFAGLSALEELHLRSNALSTLPPDVFSGLSALEELTLSSNEELAPLPGTVFSGLTSLRILILNGTGLDTVPAGLFSGLPELREIHLDGNGIEELPASLFSGLAKLEVLSLSANDLGALPDGVFSGLSELTGIFLANNRLTELSGGVFSGLTKLRTIRLTGNLLRTLPDGVFAGLTDLEILNLANNPVTLPVTVTLETVEGGRVRAKVLAGAPSDLTLRVRVENGVLERGAETLQVARGSVAGAPVQVIRTGDSGEVTVDLVTPLPSPPSAYSGYEFVRAASGLPVEVADALEREPGEEGQLRLVDRDGRVVAFNDDASAAGPAQGRLEVFHAGRWGTVCNDRFERGESVNNPDPDSTQDDEWENAAPRLACRVMGYEDGRYAGGYGQPGLPSQPLGADGRLPYWSAEDTYPPGYPVPIWLDDVTFALKKQGEETYLSGQDLADWLRVLAHDRCGYTGWGRHNCVHGEDAGLTCWNGGGQPAADAGRAAEPLTARFEARPAGHDGERPFTLRLAFSEDVTVSAADMRGHALAVTGGRVTAAARVDGRGDLWSLTVAPSGAEDVGIALSPGRECKEAGAICTQDGRQLSRGLAAIIPFLTPLTVWFEDVPGSHDGESAFTMKIAFSEGVDARGGELRNHVLAVSGGRKLSLGRAEGRKDLYEAAIRPRGDGDVTIITWLHSDPECGTAGTVCTADGRALSNSVTMVVPGPETAASGQQEPPEGENRPATGAPTVNGTVQVGETLTADVSGIADEDGLDNAGFTYQWLADGADIGGATGSGYTLADADEGKTIRVRVSFTDDAGNRETLTSAATEAVAGAEPAERPDNPTGLSAAEVSHDRVTITWDDPGDSSITGYVILRRRHDSHAQGEFTTLAADTGTAETAYTDAGVKPGKRYTYRIKAINAIGKSDRSRWLHLDTPAAPAAEPNSPATGAPTINGTARVGETLTADTSDIADTDGLANVSFTYQWLADDTEIAGAAGLTYTLADADRGKAIKVRVSFTDDAGNEETLTSAATDAVVAPEPPAKPRGLSATATHDRVVLTWDDPQDDSITGYVILRRVRVNDEGGAFSELVPDTGSAATTYTDDTVAAGTTYTYRIKAINQHGVSERSRWLHIGTPEAPAPDTPPERDYSPATGAPTINGTVQVGETLTADTSGIADEDGLENATFTYQWLGDGSAIQDATANTYTLSNSDEGKAITVQVSFTDDAGNEESLTSAATVAVAARPAPLTARFPVSPFQSSRHQGDDDRPQVIVVFNQPVQSFTKTTPSVSLTGATVQSVARHQEDGLENAWIFWLDPEGDDDLVFTLVAGQSCDGGGICTREGGMLSQGLSKTLPGPEEDEPQPDDRQPNSPATGAPTINGTAQVGETLKADASGIADPDGLEDATFTYQWLGDGSAIQDATARAYTLSNSDEGKAIKVQVSFTDDAGNEESLTSAATVAVAAAEPAEPPAKPTGLSGTATHDRVALTWDDPQDDSITGYVILRRVRENDEGGEFSELVANTGSAAASYTDDTVAAGITYTYRVKAINQHGVSERSRWLHIDTPAAP